MTEFEISNFASYEASVALKEIGFDEKCIGRHRKFNGITGSGFSVFSDFPARNSDFEADKVTISTRYAAPTFLDARRWFREKHGIIIDIKYSFNIHNDYFYVVIAEKGPGIIYKTPDGAPYLTEPEAWNSAIIKGCEIIKERK